MNYPDDGAEQQIRQRDHINKRESFHYNNLPTINDFIILPEGCQIKKETPSWASPKVLIQAPSKLNKARQLEIDQRNGQAFDLLVLPS